jgi:hypothetical protein
MGMGLLAEQVKGEKGRSFDRVRSQAGLGNLGAQGHGEAAGMRGGDQLLGIGAYAVGEAGFEAVLRLLQCAALG